MTFELIKSFEGLHYYGNIPDTPLGPDERIEVFQLEESDWDLLSNNFVDPINQLCDSLLDYGDVDFFDKEKCKLLNKWLADKIQQDISEREKTLYSVLRDFCNRAMELGTGIVIEL